MVTLDRVTKAYGRGASRVQALADVSLEIADGEFLVVVGPSGSGKSTLVHLLAGLDRPDAGHIAVAGQDFGAMSDDARTVFRRRRIGCVFQFFNLLPQLDACENAALPLLLDGVPPRLAHERAEAELLRVGLGDRLRHRPDQLSGGQMQRVAIARALAIEPLVVLADEPTGNLDSQSAEQVLALLRDSTHARGAAVVMITHDWRAASYGDRIVTLRDGRLSAADEARTIGWVGA